MIGDQVVNDSDTSMPNVAGHEAATQATQTEPLSMKLRPPGTRATVLDSGRQPGAKWRSHWHAACL